MEELKSPSNPVRFGVFEVDLQAGELRKRGVKVKLQEQPFQILAFLLDRPGEILTRDELHKLLWPANTFVDFDRGLNRAINRLRDALGDTTENPLFIETVPRRGYRFIAPLSSSIPDVSIRSKTVRWHGKWKWWAAVGVLLVSILLFIAFRIGRSRSGGTAPPPEIHSIAVLPFENLSRDPAEDYFADGMTDELITEIAKIQSLRVISRTSVIQYKNPRKSLPVIAQELGVDAILEGAVMHSGPKVRVTAQLILAKDDRHLWVGEYDRDVTDVVALQAEVAQMVADHIQLRLSSQQHAALASSHRINPEAYEAYLEGEYFRNKGGEVNLDRSVNLFKKAIDVYPSYAEAHAGMAESYIMLGILGVRPPKEVYPEAKAAATRAVELDDTVAAAHNALADVKKGYDWDWTGAEAEYKHALLLNPSYALAHMWYAELLSKLGRYDEAIAEADRARQLDPVSVGSNTVLGMVLYRAGRYDEAISACRRALELDPNHPSALWFLALAHEQKNQMPEAIKELQTAVSLSRAPLFRALLGHAYGLVGDKTRALGILRELKLESESRYVSPVDIAVVYTGLGDRDSAFAWLERAYQERAMRVQELPDPIFRNLRNDKRFASLISRIGVPGD